jgi:hypothetical protein
MNSSVRLTRLLSRRLPLIIVLAAALLAGFTITSAQETTLLATEESPQMAVDWMTLLYDRIEVEGISAPAASRMYAYAGVALYEAVYNGIPGNYSLAGQLNEMPLMPLPDYSLAYDWPTVVNGTLAPVIAYLFPAPSQETLDAINTLYAVEIEERAKFTTPEVIERSLTFGEAIGQAIIGWISTDGFIETRDMEYTLPSGEPWMWVPTTEGTTAAEPYWGMIRPFALSWVDECAIQPTWEFSTDPESTFYAQAMEVKEAGDDLTEEEATIARWWVDTPAVSGTPAGHWVSIQSQLVEQLDLNLDYAAMMYALVGISLGDAFISCWSLKYQINLLRPETYIHEYIQRSWQPYIQTPPFPEYPSGHSVVSAAAAEVLTGMFGTVAFTDETHVDEGEAPRHFTSFEAAATEAAISRLYGGIHFRSAIENGVRHGRCVGQRVLSYVSLRPIPQGGE